MQRFTGLNVWDQLAVDIEVNGNLPNVPSGAVIVLPDTSDSYVFQEENKIQSGSSGVITVDDQKINFIVNQLVSIWKDFQSFVLFLTSSSY